jgi:heme/copper-type cytochrome/quinol oxidase subunit 2
MNRFRISKLICAALVAALACPAQPLFACAMCYGAKTDSPLAAAMNWGIMSLLVVVVFVLGSVASFFIYLAKRAAVVARTASAKNESLESTQKA